MGHAPPRARKGGWQKPSPTPGAAYWEAEVRALYVRSDLEVDEFEELLDVAMRGGRPEHPDLPLFLAFQTEASLR